MKRTRRPLSRDTAHLLIALAIFCHYNHTINHTIEAYQIFNRNRIGIFATLEKNTSEKRSKPWTLAVAFVFTYT